MSNPFASSVFCQFFHSVLIPFSLRVYVVSLYVRLITSRIFLTQRTEPFVFAACLNDRAQDGKDVSWIWDVDFERLTAMEGVLSDIYVSGVRADDMALRFLYAGFPKERIHVQKDYGQLMEEATSRKLPVFVMPTYTAMLALRGTIAKRYGYKEFWQ